MPQPNDCRTDAHEFQRHVRKTGSQSPHLPRNLQAFGLPAASGHARAATQGGSLLPPPDFAVRRGVPPLLH